MQQQLLLGAKRFLKGFVSGGLAQVALIIQGGVTIHNFADANNIFTVVFAGFIVGGFLAVEKMLNYTPPVIPPDVSENITRPE